MTDNRLEMEGAIMPDVIVLYPRGFFDTTEKTRFIRDLKGIVAPNMDAIDPGPDGEGTTMSEFAADPASMIWVVLQPYDHDDVQDPPGTPQLRGTIVTYGWPDRMRNIGERVDAITTSARKLIPKEKVPVGQKAIVFTFLPKPDDAWAMA